MAYVAEREGERWLAQSRLPNREDHTGPAIRSAEKLVCAFITGNFQPDGGSSVILNLSRKIVARYLNPCGLVNQTDACVEVSQPRSRTFCPRHQDFDRPFREQLSRFGIDEL